MITAPGVAPPCIEERVIPWWQNCFLLVVPLLLANVVFTKSLPEPFLSVRWTDPPAAIAFGERFFRVWVFALPMLMPLRVATATQRLGLRVFLAGAFIYLGCWAALVVAPRSQWSLSLPGLLSLAVTPAVWLLGLTWIGDRWVVSGVPFSRLIYAFAAGLFLLFHIAHVLLAFG